MITYSADGKTAIYCGYKFRKDPKSGYFLCSKKTDIGKRERLHCYVWRKANGMIPNGFAIHHKDENKNNNEIENLECISASAHMALHSKERAEKHYEEIVSSLIKNAIPRSKEWHKSEQGRAWHSKHAKEAIENMSEKEYICTECGKHYFALPIGSEHKFCSNACKSAARRKSGVDDEQRKCACCGTIFTVNKYSARKYCTEKCKLEIRRYKAN